MAKELVTITPYIAAEWLKHQREKQRAVMPAILQPMVDAMAAGEFHPRKAEPIVMQQDPPCLLDGQTRLVACVIADVALTTWIEWE